MAINLLVDLLIRILGILRIFITPMILTTTEYGNLGLISAFLIYISFSDLGLLKQFEITVSSDVGKLRSEILFTLSSIWPRLIVSSLLLSAAVFFYSNNLFFVLWTFLGVWLLTLDSMIQIILRQYRLYKMLAISLILPAVISTMLTAPMAYYFRVEGLVSIQVLVSFISIFIGGRSIYSLIVPHTLEKEPSQIWGNSTSVWLFMGQVQMMIWVTLDRFFLAPKISGHELGLWNFGSMASMVLIGLGNTWATMKIPECKIDGAKFVSVKIILGACGVWLAGVAGLAVVTKFTLPKFADGLYWNILWLTVNLGLTFVFFLDSFERAKVKKSEDSRRWFLKKLMALVFCFGVIYVIHFFNFHPKMALVVGYTASLALLLLIQKQVILALLACMMVLGIHVLMLSFHLST